MNRGETMGKIYVVANRKGGCSKTTTVGALASALHKGGYRVLVVDMDPQGNISDWAKVNTDDRNTLYEVLSRKATMAEAIVETPYYDIAPADSALTLIETDLITTAGKELRLREALKTVKENYDFIIVDTPPNLGFLTTCAFVAADGGIIVTSDASSFASKGMGDLVRQLNEVKEYFNPNARITGILLTRVNPQTNVFQTIKELTRQFGEYIDAPIYSTYIRQTTVVMNAQMTATDLYEMPKVNAAANDYKKFTNEFLEREGYDAIPDEVLDIRK